jgi:hypothetical protein
MRQQLRLGRRVGHGLFLAACIGLVLASPAAAQEWWMGGSYSVTVPSSKTKTFTDKTSFRNFAFEARKILNDNASVGTYIGWSVMDYKTTNTAEVDNISVTGEQYRYNNIFPVLINAHYYLGEAGRARLYGGAGAGAYIWERRLEIFTVAFTDYRWHLGFMPEVGVVLPVKWNTRAILAARYNYAFASGDQPEQSYWQFSVGLGGW